MQYVKGFHRFLTGKGVWSTTPFSFYGRYTIEKKTLKKPTLCRFLREPGEDIDSTGSRLRRGVLLVRTDNANFGTSVSILVQNETRLACRIRLNLTE